MDTKHNYKYILFDFDGTIVDTIPLILESFRYVFDSMGAYEVTDEYILSTIGIPFEKTFSILPHEKMREALDMYLEYNSQNLGKGVGIFIGITDLLFRLKKENITVALVTSKRRTSAMPIIIQFDLEKYFDVMVFREDTQIHKPSPEPIYKTVELLCEMNRKKNLHQGLDDNHLSEGNRSKNQDGGHSNSNCNCNCNCNSKDGGQSQGQSVYNTVEKDSNAPRPEKHLQNDGTGDREELFLAAGINRDEILFVGDSIHDLRCAKAAAVDFAMVGWSRMDLSPIKKEEPEFWVDTPEDLLHLITKRTR